MKTGYLFKYMLLVIVLVSILVVLLTVIPDNASNSTSTIDDRDAGNRYRLTILPRHLAKLFEPYQSTPGAVVLVSWVETNTSIDLEQTASLLEGNGFGLVGSTSDYIEASKRYACVPAITTDPSWPGLSITVRVYSNGTILSYTVVSNASLAYLVYASSEYPSAIPMTEKGLREVLSILNLDSYVAYIKHSTPNLPEAKYLGLIWSGTNWHSGSISGNYVIGREAIMGGYMIILRSVGYTTNYFSIDGYSYYSRYFNGWDYWDQANGALKPEHLTIGYHGVYLYSHYGFVAIAILFK